MIKSDITGMHIICVCVIVYVQLCMHMRMCSVRTSFSYLDVYHIMYRKDQKGNDTCTVVRVSILCMCSENQTSPHSKNDSWTT